MKSNSKEYNIECSFNLHKRTFGVKFKNRVSKALKEIKNFSKKITDVNTTKIDPILNKVLCHNGTKRVPNKIRLRLSKRRYLIEGEIEDWVVYVTYAGSPNTKRIQNETFVKLT